MRPSCPLKQLPSPVLHTCQRSYELLYQGRAGQEPLRVATVWSLLVWLSLIGLDGFTAAAAC